MKRCQAGCGGARALDDAHALLAECYGTLGALAKDRDSWADQADDRARDAVDLVTAWRERYMAALQEADTLLGHDDAHTEWRERWAGLWPDAPNQEST